MKIGIMVDSYKPYVSGITNHVDITKRHLELAGHEPFVFTFGEEQVDGEPNVIRSPGLPLADSGFYLSVRYSSTARELLQGMDVIHVQHPFLSGRLALRYGAGIPIAYTNHTRYDLYAQAYLPMVPDEMSQGLLQAYMPDFCSAVDLVITPSHGMARVLRDLKVEGPIEVVPNGVDLKAFHSAQPLPRQDFGYKPEDILLVYAGRIALEKNLPLLLRAFAGVSEALPNVHLLVLGSGVQQYEEEIRTLVADLGLGNRVRMLGRIPYKELPAHLAMCDIFATASVTEVHPLSVIEAMGAGLPVAGIQSVGVGDTVQDNLTGFLSSHDLAAYTARLTRLCLDSEMRRAMSAAARRESGLYAIERTTGILLDHYQALASQPRPRRRKWSARLHKLLESFTQ